MLLDALLAKLTVEVEPLAVCQVSAGWRLRLPAPPQPLIHYVLRGRGVVLGAHDDPHPVEPLWLAVVPAGVRHALASGDVAQELCVDGARPGEGFTRVTAGSSDDVALAVACGLVNARVGPSFNLFDHLREVVVVDLSAHAELHAEFLTLLAEQSHPRPGHAALAGSLMTQCLVYTLRELDARGTILPWLNALDDPRLARAVGCILDNPAASHTVDSLADAASMSRSAFAAHFTAAFGQPPMRLLHEVRMQQAAALLARDPTLSIDDVARRVGYASRSHFTEAFRKHHGVPPTAFKGRH